jgi:hypothetical protein
MFDLSHRAVGSHPGYIFLKEHYRSDPRIINFSNQLFYNNQLVVRTDFSLRSISMDFIQAHGGMHWLQVKGRAEHPKGGSAYNQAEIAAIQTLVPRLIESLQRRQLSDASIGIVSPYREQEERIQSWVRETYGDTRRITVGTAHKFQGDEKDIMIFSTVLGPGLKEGSLHWLQTTRNLLNVAVTRARISLIMIGDWEYCHELPVDHCFRILADYVARESKRVVAEVKELSLVTAPEIKIVGVVVGPVDREYARITLRRFISSCFDYVWWTDPYFDTRVTDLFWDVFQDQDIKIKEIRLLTSEETLVSNDGYPPKLDVNRYTTLQADLASRGIRIELRCLPSRQMPHDRLFYAPGQAINMPPFDNAYGIHSRLSEYTRSSTNPDTFMKYWNEAKQV